MEKLLLLGAFLLIRYLVTSSFKKKKNKPSQAPNKSKPNKKLDDILGDFMKQLEQKPQPKVKPITVSSDSHKAEADTGKTLDWQKVSTSKYIDKNQGFKHSNYKNISNSNNAIDPIDIYDEATEPIINPEEIDLRQAVLYKEILDRKYFTI